jgi:Protein of unknown function (DUF429)
VLTAGIDLAAATADTARAVVEWSKGKAAVVELQEGCDDDDLVDALVGPEGVGLDAPLGWPDAFVASVVTHHGGGDWPGHERRALRLRLTDRYVHEAIGKVPMSVSSDRIGVVAMRAVALLHRAHGPGADRRAGPVSEVYPAGCLLRWGLPARGYKRRPEAPARRAAIVDGLLALAPWLDLGPHRDRLVAGEDALDAVLAALGARAAVLGRTDPAPEADLAVAGREGWIHLPRAGSLAGLAR